MNNICLKSAVYLSNLPQADPVFARLIPHMGGPTIDRRRDAARIALEDIENFKENLPLKHEVSRARAAQMTK